MASELEALRAENAELRRRIDEATALLDALQAESLERRAEVRALVADLPVVVSRKTVLRTLVSEGIHHPDKAGVACRALRKLGRAPRKAVRILRRRR
jgi:hypothetical protein